MTPPAVKTYPVDVQNGPPIPVIVGNLVTIQVGAGGRK